MGESEAVAFESRARGVKSAAGEPLAGDGEGEVDGRAGEPWGVLWWRGVASSNRLIGDLECRSIGAGGQRRDSDKSFR